MTNEERLEKATQVIEEGKRRVLVEHEQRMALFIPGALVFCTKEKRRGTFIRKAGPMTGFILFDGDQTETLMRLDIGGSLVAGKD